VDLRVGLIHVRAKTIDGEHWQPKTKVNRSVPVSNDLRTCLQRYAPRPRMATGFSQARLDAAGTPMASLPTCALQISSRDCRGAASTTATRSVVNWHKRAFRCTRSAN